MTTQKILIADDEPTVHESLGIYLKADGFETVDIIIVGGMDRCGSRFFQAFQGLARFIKRLLAVQGVRQVVVRREGSTVLQQGTPVIHIGLAPVLLAELTVALTHFPPVCLGGQRQYRCKKG